MVLFEERIRAPWWAWAVAWALPIMLGIAYGYATNVLVGTVIAGAAGGLASVALVRNTPTVVVDATGIRAGRAFLEAQYVGTARALDRADARRIRGVEADARAFVLLRGWVSTAVQLDVNDRRDPTPYWYISSRHPNALVIALTRARDNAQQRVEGLG